VEKNGMDIEEEDQGRRKKNLSPKERQSKE
jgi:hypothetical protein